ncbi:hypothetical protein HDE_13211 [Halotydeus destructor]|nr:hypothetical protein HDE_13211 [Halotydeus destructor]
MAVNDSDILESSTLSYLRVSRNSCLSYDQGHKPSRPKKPKSRSSAILDTMRRRGVKWYLVYAFLFAGLTLGLVYQLNDIITMYFRYETVTVLDISVPEEITAPALSMCFLFPEVIDSDNLSNRHVRIHIKRQLTTHPLTLGDFADVTLAEILEAAPKPDFLKLCSIRYPYSYSRIDKTEYCDAFGVQRYFKQQFICYQISLFELSNTVYSFEYIQNALKSPGLFFELFMDKNRFNRTSVIQFTVHSADLKPRGTSAFPVEGNRKSSALRVSEVFPAEKDVSMDLWEYYLTYNLFSSKLLGAPYRSDCLDYGTVEYESRGHCVDTCMTRMTKAGLGLYAFPAVSTTGPKLKLIMEADLAKPEVADQLAQFRDQCGQLCRRPNCVEDIYVTKLIRSDPNLGYFKIRLNVANRPTIVIEAKGKLSLPDLLVYVLSCFGIWYGLSLYSLVRTLEHLANSVDNVFLK